MYKSKSIIDAKATANGGSAIPSVDLWSSTQDGNGGYAFKQGINNGIQIRYPKYATFSVRSVRSF